MVRPVRYCWRTYSTWAIRIFTSRNVGHTHQLDYILLGYTLVYTVGYILCCCCRWMDSVSWLALECAASPLCSLVSREFSMAAAAMSTVAGAAVKVQHHSTHTHTAVLARTSAIKRFTLTLGMTVTSKEFLFDSCMFQMLLWERFYCRHLRYSDIHSKIYNSFLNTLYKLMISIILIELNTLYWVVNSNLLWTWYIISPWTLCGWIFLQQNLKQLRHERKNQVFIWAI